MRRLFLALAALTLASTATAGELDLGWGFSGELANIHNGDPSWDLFSERDGMPSRGLRAGLKLGPHVTVQGGWHRVSRGSDVSVPTHGGTRMRSPTVRMAFFADEYTLGAQFALPAAQVLVPYVAADGVVMRGVMKIDEDPDTRQNPGQVIGSGFAPGLLSTGGLELRTPKAPVGWQVAVFLEAGYAWFAPGDFGAFGEMKPGGFTVRGGLGMRFE